MVGPEPDDARAPHDGALAGDVGHEPRQGPRLGPSALVGKGIEVGIDVSVSGLHVGTVLLSLRQHAVARVADAVLHLVDGRRVRGGPLGAHRLAGFRKGMAPPGSVSGSTFVSREGTRPG